MLIRSEAPSDILMIDRLLKKAFDTNAEAALVMALRGNANLTLSLVACSDEGKLIGHVMFSPVLINGVDCGVQALAPVCVHPDYRHQGIATRLIKEGVVILEELGYCACVVHGESTYYRSIGFELASDHGLKDQCIHTHSPMLFMVFNAFSLNEIDVEIQYSPEFRSLMHVE